MATQTQSAKKESTQSVAAQNKNLDALLQQASMAGLPPEFGSVRVVDREALEALDMRKAMRDLEQKKKLLHARYIKEKKVPVVLAPSYAAYFGKVMMVSINGISITIPVDGRPYKVPETFATEIGRRRVAVDNIERKKLRMADISKNFEQSPGQLKLF